jgi:hypothetical protein
MRNGPEIAAYNNVILRSALFSARLEGWATGVVLIILRGSPKRRAPQDDGGAPYTPGAGKP